MHAALAKLLIWLGLGPAPGLDQALDHLARR